MDNLKRFLTQRNTIIAGAGIAGVGLLGYYFWCKSSEPTYFKRNDHQGPKPLDKKFEDFKHHHLERVVELKKKMISEEKLASFTKPVIDEIHELAFEISEDEFRSILKANREQRRKLIDHEKEKYETEIVSGVKRIESSFHNSIKHIFQEVHQDYAKYEKSILALKESDGAVEMKGAALWDAVAARVPSINQTVDFNKQFSLKSHQIVLDTVTKVKYKPTHQEYTRIIREAMVHDLALREHKLEAEDLRELARMYASQNLKDLQVQINQALAAA